MNFSRNHRDYTLYVHNTHILLHIEPLIQSIHYIQFRTWENDCYAQSYTRETREILCHTKKNHFSVNDSKASNIRISNIDLQVPEFLGFLRFLKFLRQLPQVNILFLQALRTFFLCHKSILQIHPWKIWFVLIVIYSFAQFSLFYDTVRRLVYRIDIYST